MSPIEIASILLVLVAVGVAWRAVRRTETLERKIERLQSAVFETRADLRQAREELDAQMSSLDVALKRSTGQLKFDPSMRLAELYRIEPRAQSLLAAFHIGGCAHCAVDDDQTLSEAVLQNGRNLDQVLAALNNLPADGEPLQVRVPNVQFEM